MLAFALAAVFVAVALSQWHSYRGAAEPRSSASEIIIHGTPVCVFRHGDDIAARVGRCPPGLREEREGPSLRAPFHGGPGMRLPPGHPPIDEDRVPDGDRIIPI